MKEYIKNKKILVTGGAGFLGTKVCVLLRERGAKEIFIPRKKEYDLTKMENVKRVYDDSQPDTVIHLAAEVGGIGANRANPGRFFYANLSMGLNLIEEARIRKISKFVQVGTICSYPKFTPVPFKEDDLWNGYPEETNAPYGIAKKSLIVMLQAYRAQYDLNGICLLPVNLYGPGDNFDPCTSHVIPAIIRKCVEAVASKRNAVYCWGTGSASREFLFVDDCANGIITATEKYDGIEPVNLGTNTEITIRNLVEMIAIISGFSGELIWDHSQPDGQPRRCLDVSRARDLFGFVARTKLKDGLRATIEWFKSQINATK